MPELRADFRQYYHISFDKCFSDSLIETSDLVFGLPRGSRYATKINPEYEWTTHTYLLANVSNELKNIAYGLSNSSKHKAKKPQFIEPPKKSDLEKKNAPKMTTKDIKNIFEMIHSEGD